MTHSNRERWLDIFPLFISWACRHSSLFHPSPSHSACTSSCLLPPSCRVASLIYLDQSSLNSLHILHVSPNSGIQSFLFLFYTLVFTHTASYPKYLLDGCNFGLSTGSEGELCRNVKFVPFITQSQHNVLYGTFCSLLPLMFRFPHALSSMLTPSISLWHHLLSS